MGRNEGIVIGPDASQQERDSVLNKWCNYVDGDIEVQETDDGHVTHCKISNSYITSNPDQLRVHTRQERSFPNSTYENKDAFVKFKGNGSIVADNEELRETKYSNAEFVYSADHPNKFR